MLVVMASPRIVRIILLLGALVAGVAARNAEPLAGIRMKLDSQWSFQEGDPAGAEQTNFDDHHWQKIELPHDWTVAQPIREANPRYNGFYPRGIGWYRKHLQLDASFAARQVYLEFEGIYRNSTLWVNGQKTGSHPSGYTGVIYDLTPYVRCDGQANLVAVRVDGREGEGWWYEGCGIYRHAWLIATDKIHVSNWGTFVTTPQVSATGAVVRVRITVQNDAAADECCGLETRFLDARGQTVGRVQRNELVVGSNASRDLTQETTVVNPRLWSPDTPYLYRARTAVFVSGKRVNVCETPFGVRWFEFMADRGCFLNGRPLQLRGMCIHHDFGGLGVALPDRANEKTVEIMKQMGCNFLRSAHNDPAPSLLEACDRLGLLVWAETRYLGPSKTAAPPLRELIRRDRNHPSIICWSLANTAGSKDGRETQYLKDLNQVAHEEDPTRPSAFACEGNADANANGFALVTDIMGYNGGGMGIDDRDHQLYPQRKMLVSEFSSGRGARGVYEEKILARVTTERLGDGRTVTNAGQYFSTYDLCRSHEAEWSHIAQRPWLAGGAMWSGIDYGGETCGWPMVTSQFGVLDRCRLPNDAYFYYRQEWTTNPMVHLCPHWTWPGKEGRDIEVWSYSNCEAVELFLNGKSLGTKPCQPLTHLAWQVPYQPGTLSARALKMGKVVCTDETKTAGAPARIQLLADRKAIAADGCDLSFVTVRILDSQGNVVPVADSLVSVRIEGRGRLLGLCSGDPASHENPKAGQMKAFNGLLLAIVQSDGRPGDITVRASSAGLSAGPIRIKGLHKPRAH
jgi:beta-galactosidase